MTKKFQSAKVYVIDFHFSSDDKQNISKKKQELDRYFDEFLRVLREEHNGDPVEEVFLRKH